jgi:cwf21 domain
MLKKGNDELLEHAKKRKVEAKIFELQEAMVERGYTDAEIEAKVSCAARLSHCCFFANSMFTDPCTSLYEFVAASNALTDVQCRCIVTCTGHSCSRRARRACAK